eukprot:1413132-Rhodomonas_salina.1
MRGADIAYGTMRCVVLILRTVLCSAWCWHRIWYYAMRGTDIAYGTMQCVVLTSRMVLAGLDARGPKHLQTPLGRHA